MIRSETSSRASVKKGVPSKGDLVSSEAARRRPARPKAYRSGDRVHVYDFGGPDAPRYLGQASVVKASDTTRSTYWVNFEGDPFDRLAVVASTLQGDPQTVLGELTAHWGQRISREMFGEQSVVRTRPVEFSIAGGRGSSTRGDAAAAAGRSPADPRRHCVP
jgi:hypothetical protein